MRYVINFLQIITTALRVNMKPIKAVFLVRQAKVAT